MKILFVDISHNFYDLHGVYSLIAVLRREGLTADYVASNSYSHLLKAIRAAEPDLVCYSSFSTTLERYREFDSILKEGMRVRSLIGGPGPTYSPKLLFGSTIDAYCVGEGEAALTDYIRSGFIPARNVRACSEETAPQQYNDFVDLDSLPFPDREIVYARDSLLRDQPSKQFFSGRGCPYDCTYCFNHTFRNMFRGCGPAIRKKSVDYMLEEISQVKKRYPLSSVVFNDDLFIIDKKWVFEFCERYPGKIGLPFTCNVRSNLVDEDIVSALSHAGCKTANWSIESGDEYMRNTVLRRNISTKSILKTAELLEKHRIQSRIGNIIGLPGETKRQLHATLEMTIKARPALSIASIFLPFPGLELTRYAIKGGYLKEDHDALPGTFYQESPLNISRSENRSLRSFMYLFPIFVKFPELYRNKPVRHILMSLPLLILSPLFELVTTLMLMGLYVVRTPLRVRARMLWRHVRNTRFGDILETFTR